jgi:hypothetical protein
MAVERTPAVSRPPLGLLIVGAVTTLITAFGPSLPGGNLLSAERPVALSELQDPQPTAKDATGNDSRQMSKADEAAALAFVKEHHAELANLLRVLRTMNQPQYRNAIRDLNRNRVRLEQFRRRSEDRYELELRAWQVKSRIQLMTARLQVNDTPALRKELTAALHEQVDLRRQTLQAERQRLEERLSKIDDQLKRIDETDAEQQLKQLLNKLDETKRSGGKPNGSAKSVKQ